MSSLRFAAVDVETANSSRGSICAIAVTRVVNGHVDEERVWLIRPPEGLDTFDRGNIRLHKITPAKVADSPRFVQIWPEIEAFIGDGGVVIGHNAAFDTSSIREACSESGIEWPEIDYACSMILGRQAFPELGSHTLPKLADHCGVTLTNHHDPAQDARATAEIVMAMCDSHGVQDIRGLADALNVELGEITAHDYRPCRKRPTSKSMKAAKWFGNGESEMPTPRPANTGPLRGQTVVVTGELDSLTRQGVREVIAAAGGTPKDSVVMSTTILVVGDGYAGDLERHSSTKVRRAQELIARGKDIEILTEDEFLVRADLSTSVSTHEAEGEVETRAVADADVGAGPFQQQVDTPSGSTRSTPPGTPILEPEAVERMPDPVAYQEPTSAPWTTSHHEHQPPQPGTGQNAPPQAPPRASRDQRPTTSSAGRSTAKIFLFGALASVACVLGALFLVSSVAIAEYDFAERVAAFFMALAIGGPGLWWWRCHLADEKFQREYKAQKISEDAVNAQLRGGPDEKWMTETPPPAPVTRHWSRVTILSILGWVVVFVTAGVGAAQ